MSLNARNVPSNRKVVPHLEAGAYPARLSQVLAIGLQKGSYKGEEKEPVHKLLTVYELLDEFMTDEDGNEDRSQPRVISEDFPFYSLDSDRAKSTKRYTALDPELVHDGDWAELIGTPCILTVVVNEKAKGIYNNIAGVSAMRTKEAEKAPDAVLDTKVFDIDDPDMDVYWSLWPWIRKRMTEDNLDFEGSVLEKAIEENPEPSKEDREDTKKASKKERKQRDNSKDTEGEVSGDGETSEEVDW